MTLEEAQAFLDARMAGELDPDPHDPFRILWAKFYVTHHEQLLARCRSEVGRRVIQERFRIHCAILMEHLLVQ